MPIELVMYDIIIRIYALDFNFSFKIS